LFIRKEVARHAISFRVTYFRKIELLSGFSLAFIIR